jgi:hypothetical protein
MIKYFFSNVNLNLFDKIKMQLTNERIPKNYRSFVYCVAIKNGGWREWAFAWKQYEVEKDLVSKKSLQYGKISK